MLGQGSAAASAALRNSALVENLSNASFGRAGVEDRDPVLTNGAGVEEKLTLGHPHDESIVGNKQLAGISVDVVDTEVHNSSLRRSWI